MRTINRLSAEALAGQSPRKRSTQSALNFIGYVTLPPLGMHVFLSLGAPGVSGICDSPVVPRMALFESGFHTGAAFISRAVNLDPSPLPGFTCRTTVSALSVLIKIRSGSLCGLQLSG